MRLPESPSVSCLLKRGCALWLAAGMAWAAPPLPYSAAVAERFAAPAQRYDTPALAAGRQDFTSNDELAAFMASLADGRRVRSIDAGASHSGTRLQALHFSQAPGRPVALLFGQQHGNEPAGSEALLAVASALADARHPLAAVLDRIDVVLLPRANPDAARLDRRSNAQGLDVNRDHLLLATPEASAIARLAREFEPALVVDAHEHLALARAQGAPARHDLLIQYATTPNLAPALVRVSESWFRLPLFQDVEDAQLRVDWYHVRTATPSRMAMGGIQPELARNAYGLRHAVSVLIESRGLDLGRLHYERRVHSQVVAISSLLRSAAAHADALAGLQIEAAAAEARLACSGQIVVEAAQSPTRRELLTLDATTGADRAVTVDWDSALTLQAITVRDRPCGYWLDAGAADAVDRLRALGLSVRRIESPLEMAVQRYRETARGAPGEASAPLRLTVELVDDNLQAAAGGYFVPMDQPRAALAAAALEPDSGHSYVAHRVLTLGQLARVMRAP